MKNRGFLSRQKSVKHLENKFYRKKMDTVNHVALLILIEMNLSA